jgi:sugar lactone lactonase YvrE
MRVRRAGIGRSAVVGLALLAGCGDPVSIVGDIPGLMRVVAGIPETPGRSAEDRAVESRIDGPAGLALDAGGVLFVAESENSRVIAVTSSGRLEVLHDDFFCSREACLEEPAGLALDPAGRVVVADPAGNRIWRLDPATGAAEVLAGTGERASGPDGAVAAEAPLSAPYGVAVTPDGARLFIADTRNHRVREVTLATGRIETRVGTGATAWTGDLLDGGATSLSGPRGVATSAFGLLFVSDTGHAVVWRSALTL